VARAAKLADLGLNTDGDLERRLGKRVVESAPESDAVTSTED
jgi:hypothetical protein